MQYQGYNIPPYDLQQLKKLLINLRHSFEKMTDLEDDLKNLDSRTTTLEVFKFKIKKVVQDYRNIHTLQQSCKKRRRTANLVDRVFICPYQKCGKSYGTDISLNLHIRLKHNGGSKIEREELAERMLIAQFEGQPEPQHSLNLPPNFLQQFCLNYEQFTKKLEQTYNKQITF